MRSISALLVAAFATFGLASCANDTPPGPVGPESSSRVQPWNQGDPRHQMGQMGMMEQNRHRR